MTGVIWTVQLVHYPLFARVGTETFPVYHSLHTQSMALVVMFPMLIELITSGILALNPPPGWNRHLLNVGFVLTVLTWGITIVSSIPAHGRLAAGFDPETHRTLVTTNWLRTLCWTAHSLLLLEQLRRLLGKLPGVAG